MIGLSDIMSLDGRRALITGGSGHIASAFANTLCSMGCDLILVDRNKEKLDNLRNKLIKKWECSVSVYVCDLELESERNQLIDFVLEKPEPLNILINNAAFVADASLQGWAVDFNLQTINTWRRAIEVNVTTAFHLSQGLLSKLKENKNGSIINIGSIYGELGPDWRIYDDTNMANPAAYAVSKGGLFQLTRWLATTVAPDVRVNAISPGGVARGQDRKFVEEYCSRTPMARMATENDFIGALAFLSGDASSYVTGQIIRVDGGWGVW